MPDFGGGYSQPAQSVTALSTGVAGTPGRAILINCTGTGTVTITFPDNTTMTINIVASTIYQFNWSVLKVTTGTATATYFNLY